MARHFKRENPEALPKEDILRQHWESDALLKGIPWDEFRLLVMEGWEKVCHPQGSGPLAEALAAADQTPVPEAERYSDPQIRRLVSLCAALQKRAGDQPFHLAASAVAEEFGIVADLDHHLVAVVPAERARGELLHVSHYRLAVDGHLQGLGLGLELLTGHVAHGL